MATPLEPLPAHTLEEMKGMIDRLPRATSDKERKVLNGVTEELNEITPDEWQRFQTKKSPEYDPTTEAGPTWNSFAWHVANAFDLALQQRTPKSVKYLYKRLEDVGLARVRHKLPTSERFEKYRQSVQDEIPDEQEHGLGPLRKSLLELTLDDFEKLESIVVKSSDNGNTTALDVVESGLKEVLDGLGKIRDARASKDWEDQKDEDFQIFCIGRDLDGYVTSIESSFDHYLGNTWRKIAPRLEPLASNTHPSSPYPHDSLAHRRRAFEVVNRRALPL